MLWEIDIYPNSDQPDSVGTALAHEAAELGLGEGVSIAAARGFLIQCDLTAEQIRRLAHELLTDMVVERPVIARIGDEELILSPGDYDTLVHVLPKPGVTDAVAQSAQRAIADLGLKTEAVATLRKYWLKGVPAASLPRITNRLLANESIEHAVVGPLKLERLHLGSPGKFALQTVPLSKLSDAELVSLSKARTLSLTLVEMQTVQKHFRELRREPTDIELETVAQTWSEHCSHKTLAGQIDYTDEKGSRKFGNMLKETIFAATQELRKKWGDKDWCVSVFKDNAGVVLFDDQYNVAFKVETHNRPSAIEPYGGANTGLGGVIRDTLGTGLGAKPIASTDVFCFAPPNSPADQLPPGVIHPRRLMRKVVAGVRDYGNRMGIPTVNGAVLFDPRYVGNPLVFCGNVGLIPKDKSFKHAQPNDLIVAIGGRTGRDGIHGATFSSVELTSESETLSGGAVQIGNAITEKMFLDVLLTARDRGLFNAVTDCGAGGFSSAVGEMGEEIGAEVHLDKAPLKYEGLTYTEIWISEAQERMVLAVSENRWQELFDLCESEGVEAVVLGRFVPGGKLTLKYQGETVGQLAMEFLHNGRPKVVREARFAPKAAAPVQLPKKASYDELLKKILALPSVASKEWIIRQYDHEVQGGSVIKPLVGEKDDGPGDAAVLRPVLSSKRGLVIGCGMNPWYGDYDPADMALCAIDEAIRNCVAVGADPSRVAILDNFCWGYTDRPETLGSLVRAAIACRDAALAYEAPFISGKDSLNNEYSYDADGTRKTISIPGSLLISAMAQVEDVAKCVTMDLKEAGNRLYLVGITKDELAGSQATIALGLTGGQVPQVDLLTAPKLYAAFHQAIRSGTVRSCHDLSDGGLAVAAAEMAFAGGLGATLVLSKVPVHGGLSDTATILFSESATRFLCEVEPGSAAAFEQSLAGFPVAYVGDVTSSGRLMIQGSEGSVVINSDLADLKEAWQAPLRW